MKKFAHITHQKYLNRFSIFIDGHTIFMHGDNLDVVRRTLKELCGVEVYSLNADLEKSQPGDFLKDFQIEERPDFEY